MMMNTALPDRWKDYMNIGSRIVGTCFVPLKVPLKEDYFRARPQHMMFTPSMVVDTVMNLTTVIDLTNTNRYYHPREFTDRRVDHKKVLCLGHAIPNGNVVQTFFSIVDDHVRRNSIQGTDSVIGVHCTHGINRTGYLICLYMIKRLGFTPNDALKAFCEARGHPVERTNYIDDLRRLSAERAGRMANVGLSVGPEREQRPRQTERRRHLSIHPYQRRQSAGPPPEPQLPPPRMMSTMPPQQPPTPWRQIVESPFQPPPPPIRSSRPRCFQPTPYQIADRRHHPYAAPPDHPHQWRHRLPGQHPPRHFSRWRQQQ